jgi:threonine synthase
MENYLTGFRCLYCDKEFAADYEGYICDACGQNLDAMYDYEAIGNVFSVEALKENHQYDVWRYKPLFPFKDMKYIPPLQMSLTPLYKCTKLEQDTGLKNVYLKDDTRLPSGSFKDRAGSVVMTVAREKNVKGYACASTGNAGCSWACMGAACGVKVTIYVPKAIPKGKLAQLKVYGADVRIVDGNYDRAYDLCAKECLEKGFFNRNTGYNPYTREGKKSVAFEIWEQLGYKAPGAVFVSVGDGNIISGTWKGFRDLKALNLIDQMPQIVAVQSDKSDAVIRTIEKMRETGVSRVKEVEVVSATTRADSISVDQPRDGLAAARAVLETDGKAVRVSDEEILDNIPYIAAATGIFAEPSASTSVAGLRKFAAQDDITILRDPVVCLVTGNGLKDIGAVLERQ